VNTVSIPANATAKAITKDNKPPRGATHFRYTEDRRKPVIEPINKIACLAGCTGKLEFGTMKHGRAKNGRITPKAFDPIGSEKSPSAEKPTQSAASSNGHRVTILEANRPPEVIETGAVAEPDTATGRKNKIHGFSACAVAKALGKAGLKYDEADKIMKAHGIVMPPASLKVQMGFGRNEKSWERHGKPAALSEDQIAELRKEVAV